MNIFMNIKWLKFLFTVLIAVTIFLVPRSNVLSNGFGQFLVSDYGSGTVSGGFYWRGYHFRVTEETVVTGLVGGGTGGGDFTVAIFEVDVPSGSDPAHAYTIDSIVASVIPPGVEPDQEVILPVPVTLLPGVDYMLAQGRIDTGSSHHRVDYVNVDNLLHGSFRIDLWLPESGQSINFGITNPVEDMVGRTAINFNDTRPRIGFLFQSSVASASVSTL